MMGEMNQDEPERPAPDWYYPYAGAAFDWGSNLQVSVRKRSDRAVGYAIVPTVQFSNKNPAALGFFDEFCERHDLGSNVTNTETSQRLEIGRLDDVERFIRLVRPFIIVREEAAQLLLKNLLPGLQMDKDSNKEGFYELVGYVDQIREVTGSAASAKYDQAYFREEWNL